MEKEIITTLMKYTNHNHLKLTSRGNTAIKQAINLVKKLNPKPKFLTVDQGGWFTYLNLPKKQGFRLETLKTDYGIIKLDNLEKSLEKKDVSAIIYSNPAGYYANQPIKEIYEICNKYDCLVIMDITGCIGTIYSNGNYADLIVCSFGKWKPVNLGYGGFISSNKKIEIEENNCFKEEYQNSLKNKLNELPLRYQSFKTINTRIKKDLKAFEILHPDKWGINVIIKYNDSNEKQQIINYCEKNNFQYTICPRYIRVKENAISIEVKRKE